jgi:predicted nucleotidyltransferase
LYKTKKAVLASSVRTAFSFYPVVIARSRRWAVRLRDAAISSLGQPRSYGIAMLSLVNDIHIFYIINCFILNMLSIEQHKELIVPVLKRYNVQHAAIFGSVAKRSATAISDIDLLIEPAAGFTLFKMLELELEIAELVNQKVDLVEYSALKASIKDEVLNPAIAIL